MLIDKKEHLLFTLNIHKFNIFQFKEHCIVTDDDRSFGRNMSLKLKNVVYFLKIVTKRDALSACKKGQIILSHIRPGYLYHIIGEFSKNSYPNVSQLLWRFSEFYSQCYQHRMWTYTYTRQLRATMFHTWTIFAISLETLNTATDVWPLNVTAQGVWVTLVCIRLGTFVDI